MFIPSLSQHLLMTSVLKDEAVAARDVWVSAAASLAVALVLMVLTPGTGVARPCSDKGHHLQSFAHGSIKDFTVWSFSGAPCITDIRSSCIDLGEAGMTDASRSRTNIAALLTILALSAATMVWLFWHFPLITSVATVAVLAVLGVCARLARLSDADMTDLQQHKQGV